MQAAFESAFEAKPLRDSDAEGSGVEDEATDIVDESSGVEAEPTDTTDSDDSEPTDESEDGEPTDESDDETLWEAPAAEESPPEPAPDTADEAIDPDNTAFDTESDPDSDGTASDEFTSMGAGEGLTDEQYMAVITALSDAPAAADVDAETWTPATLQAYLNETYGIDYPREECIELLRSAGHDVDE